MSDKRKLGPVAAALGTTFAISLAASPLANAAENPFSMTEHGSSYTVAEGECGEGKCGDKEEGEGKCGEKGDSES